MRKFMMAAGLAVLLTGCGDDDIYDNYVNPQYAVRFDIQKDVIKFRNGVFTVKAGTKAKSLPISLELKRRSRLGLLKSKRSKMASFTKVWFLRRMK